METERKWQDVNFDNGMIFEKCKIYESIKQT